MECGYLHTLSCFSEFIPYVFQILSLLIELHKDTVPETYMVLFPHLLTPLLWERPGNIPPLVRLLQAYIEKGAKQVEPERLVSYISFLKSNSHRMPITTATDDSLKYFWSIFSEKVRLDISCESSAR